MTALASAAGSATHADPVIVTLLVIAIAAGYAVSLYLWPIRACSRCKGARVISHRARGFRSCPRCAGTGRTRRIGATAIHRFYWSARGEAARERRRATAERLRASYRDLLADTRAATGTRQALDDLHMRAQAEPPDTDPRDL
jgi:hypothetical protein